MVDVNSKVYPQITEFGGINTGAAPFNIGDNESTDERNLGSDNYPSISQWKEADEFPGNDEFKEILYIGYLFDGDIFCIGTKVEDVGIAEEGHCYIYKYKDGVWKKFISSFTDARGNNQSTSEGIKIGNKNADTKNFVIRITDKRLLEATGGIVQGMSGSPIIQNGKLVGAVTHVLVNDPTKGYGIFIENMLKNMPEIIE